MDTGTKQRYKIVVEYVGTGFAGWQRQRNALSIQEIIEDAIYKFSQEKVILHVAGRTDAGVHATCQVAHFDFPKTIEAYQITKAINHFVRPHLVSIVNCTMVPMEFHARFSAKMRHYLYRIINRSSQIAIDHNRAWWFKQELDINSMLQAADYLIGNNDFTSFRAKHCQSKSPIKTLSKLQIIKESDKIRFYLSAPSFLHHMVRNIIGSLVLVGIKKWQPQYIKEVLQKKDRSAAGPTAPAEGLYLIGVDY